MQERGAMAFTFITTEVIETARAVVSAAAHGRIAECGVNDEKRAARCRERETGEQAAQDRLGVALTNKAATDRA
jgi:hypothetical protein